MSKSYEANLLKKINWFICTYVWSYVVILTLIKALLVNGSFSCNKKRHFFVPHEESSALLNSHKINYILISTESYFVFRSFVWRTLLIVIVCVCPRGVCDCYKFWWNLVSVLWLLHYNDVWLCLLCYCILDEILHYKLWLFVFI